MKAQSVGTLSKMALVGVCALAALTITPTAYASAGGDSGGGGNTTATQIAQTQDIIKSVNNAHGTRLMMAYAWQRQSRFPLPSKFNDFINFFSQIKLVKKVGPCLDPQNNSAKEGSADVQKMEICFSVAQILGRNIPLKLLDIKIAGLYAHEAAHLLNQNEIQAVALQNQVEQTLTPFGFTFENLKKSRASGLLDWIGGAFDGWPTIIDSSPSDVIGLCDNTNEIANLIFETDGLLFDEQKPYGMLNEEVYRLTSLDEDYLWEAFRTRGFIVGLTCASKTNNARYEYENLFSKSNYAPLPAKDLMCKFNTTLSGCDDIARMTSVAVSNVTFVRRGNRQDVLSEVAKMEKIRLDLIKSFRRPIWLK